MKTVALYTLGCKVSQYETEAIAEGFEERGFRAVAFTEKADVYASFVNVPFCVVAFNVRVFPDTSSHSPLTFF